MIKRILHIALVIVLIVGLIAAVVIMQKKQEQIRIKAVDIQIIYSGSDYYILQEDVEQMLEEVSGNILEKTWAQIEEEAIELHIEKSPFISEAEVYMEINGTLKIRIYQRHPIARIESLKSRFYLASDGFIMPISDKNVSHVMIVNGHLKNYNIEYLKGKNIKLLENEDELNEILEIANYIAKDPFFKPMIDQVYLNKDDEYELIPKLGRHFVLLGKIDQMDEKLNNLQEFYKYGISKSGWNVYKKINLKYKNQVVCTKN